MNGRIVAFDENKCIGLVETDGKIYQFHSISFRSATSFRWPRIDEQVEVVFKHGRLLSVEAE